MTWRKLLISLLLEAQFRQFRRPEIDMRSPATDLFGPRPRPFAGAGCLASPGTGPAGETCGTCAHCRPSGGWYKCALVRQTPGKGTDISRRAPACLAWQSSKVSWWLAINGMRPAHYRAQLSEFLAQLQSAS